MCARHFLGADDTNVNKTDNVPALLLRRKRQKTSKWVNQYKVIQIVVRALKKTVIGGE